MKKILLLILVLLMPSFALANAPLYGRTRVVGQLVRGDDNVTEVMWSDAVVSGGDNKTMITRIANEQISLIPETDNTTFTQRVAVPRLATTVDNTVPRFDGVTGAVQGSTATIDDTGNVATTATLGNEMAPALEAANWTCQTDTGGWSAGSGVLTKTANATLTRTATPSGTFTVVAGKTYKVVITVSAISGIVGYTLGGVAGINITSATTSTDYITANTTAKIILSGTAAVTATITSISVKALDDNSGDLTVNGNLKVNSPILSNCLIGSGTGTTYPQYSFAGDPTTGIGNRYLAGYFDFYAGGALVGRVSSNAISLPRDSFYFGLGASGDLIFGREAANTFAQRNSSTQQIYRIYNTADAAWQTLTNYERLALTGVAGASVNLTAETAGTGGDNLDVVLTPAGTGSTKIVGTARLGSTDNYASVGSTGDLSFVGSAGFYPRTLNQAAKPAAGTGATQLDTSEMCIWTDSDDAKCYHCYNHGGTVKCVELQ